jgi:RND family efflux transporter MFP subunit
MRRATSQTFVGSLEAIRHSTVGSAVEGRIDAVYVEQGQRVSGPRPAESAGSEAATGGDPLAQLRTDTVEIEIAAAQVSLETAQSALAELEANLPAEIALAESSVQEATALLDYARQSYERARRLATGEQVGIAASELELAYSQFKAQESRLSSATTTLNKLRATQDVRLAIARHLVASRQEELRLLEDTRDKHTAYAPFDGYVLSKLVEVGDWVPRGAPIAEVVQLDPIRLTVHVPQSYLSSLQRTMDRAAAGEAATATVRVEGLTETYNGNVMYVIPQADLRSRSFPVVIHLQNPQTESGHVLRPGMLCQASLALGEESDVLVVRKDALVLGNDRIDVVVAAPDGPGGALVARPVPVEVGVAIGDHVEIRGAIREGDRVVVSGNERLMPGQPLILVEPAQPAPGAKSASNPPAAR